MKRTFFDYISSASKEKIHSQTLGWLLSKNCNALEEEAKKSFLQLLIGKNVKDEFTIKDVLVEFFDIDLLIVCDSFVVVIENKLKSSEHSNQLEKYLLLVQKDIEKTRRNLYLKGLPGLYNENKIKFESTRQKIQDSLGKSNVNSYFVYLNFINKNASNDQYNNITYIEILDFLKSIKPKLSTNTDATILASYKTSLENLEKCLIEFGRNPYMRRWVAENSMFNKKDMLSLGTSFPKKLDSEIMTYVIENNLINTLQLNFLNLVVNGLSSQIDSTDFEVNASLSQTRQGNIHIKFKKMQFSFSNVTCNFGYQIQISPNKPRGKENIDSIGTDKIAITTNVINHRVLIVIDKQYFRKLLKNDCDLTHWSPRGIKKNGSKGNYISITKTFEANEYFTDFNVDKAIEYIKEKALKKESFIYSKIEKTYNSMKRTSKK